MRSTNRLARSETQLQQNTDLDRARRRICFIYCFSELSGLRHCQGCLGQTGLLTQTEGFGEKSLARHSSERKTYERKDGVLENTPEGLPGCEQPTFCTRCRCVSLYNRSGLDAQIRGQRELEAKTTCILNTSERDK